jgi:hypothetical protein
MISILVGIAAGLIYAWAINPLQYVDAVPSTLRDDYRADLVLMVAEVYQSDSDLEHARSSLKQLMGSEPPMRSVQQAIITAQELGYPSRDLETLANLAINLEKAGSTP